MTRYKVRSLRKSNEWMLKGGLKIYTLPPLAFFIELHRNKYTKKKAKFHGSLEQSYEYVSSFSVLTAYSEGVQR